MNPSQQDSAKSLGADFVQDLAGTSERLLLMFDSLLTVDEVETGRELSFTTVCSIQNGIGI